MEDVIKISNLRYQIAKQRVTQGPELSNLITITFSLEPPCSEAIDGGNEPIAVVSPTVVVDDSKSVNINDSTPVDVVDTGSVPQEMKTTPNDGQTQISKKRRKKEAKLKRAVEQEKLEMEQAVKSGVTADGQTQISKRRKKLEEMLQRAVEQERLEAEQAFKSMSVESGDHIDEDTSTKDSEVAPAVIGPDIEELRREDKTIQRLRSAYKFKPLEPL